MIQIAIMGFGTVGTGVAKVVSENARQIERKLGEPLQVKTILVRHFKDGPYRQLMTDDFARIEEDDDILLVFDKTLCSFDHHLRNLYMMCCLLIECR